MVKKMEELNNYLFNIYACKNIVIKIVLKHS